MWPSESSGLPTMPPRDEHRMTAQQRSGPECSQYLLCNPREQLLWEVLPLLSLELATLQLSRYFIL